MLKNINNFSDLIVRKVKTIDVYRLLVGELTETKTKYYFKNPKRDSRCPCCDSDGFTIHKNTNRFKCYSCGRSGSCITLVLSVFSITRKEAINFLSNRFKIKKDPIDKINNGPF
jgi:hypothetical protein